MKLSTEKQKAKAVKDGVIEYSTENTSPSRVRLIKFINLMSSLESRGIDVKDEEWRDYESFLAKFESMGLNIPGTPYKNLPAVEKRNLDNDLAELWEKIK
jgi:hypothetical protein